MPLYLNFSKNKELVKQINKIDDLNCYTNEFTYTLKRRNSRNGGKNKTPPISKRSLVCWC